MLTPESVGELSGNGLPRGAAEQVCGLESQEGAPRRHFGVGRDSGLPIACSALVKRFLNAYELSNLNWSVRDPKNQPEMERFQLRFVSTVVFT